MLYSIIDTKKGEDYGFVPAFHRLTQDGKQMVVNEKELKVVDSDIHVAATLLGGRVMTEAEVFNELTNKK